MKLRILKPTILENGSITMSEIPLEQLVVDNYALLSIDGSTTNSGLAVIRQLDGALMYSISASRETSDNETPVKYKVKLKRAVQDILTRNKLITDIFYEEPVIANITSVANLFMLRTFIEELIVENEPDFDYIKHVEVSNMRWKKEFLAPDKVPQGTENQKKAVRAKMEGYLPFLNVVTQDEIDAACMGWVAAGILRRGGESEELQSKKKAKPFKYNITFIAANDDDGMLTDLWDVYKGPKQILENGIYFCEINAKANFEKSIYESMGNEDKLVIIKFSSKHHGNVVLQYKIGSLAAQYDYIYALVWRTNRK